MKYLHHLGGSLFAIAFAIATGVDKNPIQAIYALVLMGAALVCFRAHEKYEQKQKRENEKTKETSSEMQEAA